MICRSCCDANHEQCTAIVRRATTWCDCQHGGSHTDLGRWWRKESVGLLERVLLPPTPNGEVTAV